MSRQARERKRGLRWYANYDTTYKARDRRTWRKMEKSASSQAPHMLLRDGWWVHVNAIVPKAVIHNGRKP